MTSGLCCHCEAKPKQSNFLNNSKYTWLGGRGEAENEKCPVDILDAIHPCIAPFGQLSLPKSVPDRFFPLTNSTGSNLGGEAARRANTMDGMSQRLEQRMFKAGPLAKPGWLSLGLRL
jgi:hypothetical protein